MFECLGPQEVLFGEVVEPWKVQANGKKYITLDVEVYSFSPLLFPWRHREVREES